MNKINKMILLLLISNFGTCLSVRISSFCRFGLKDIVSRRVASQQKIFCWIWIDENYFVGFGLMKIILLIFNFLLNIIFGLNLNISDPLLPTSRFINISKCLRKC